MIPTVLTSLLEGLVSETIWHWSLINQLLVGTFVKVLYNELFKELIWALQYLTNTLFEACVMPKVYTTEVCCWTWNFLILVMNLWSYGKLAYEISFVQRNYWIYVMNNYGIIV